MAVQLFVERFVVVGNIQSLGQERWNNSEVNDTESVSNTALFAENKLHLIVFINRLKNEYISDQYLHTRYQEMT